MLTRSQDYIEGRLQCEERIVASALLLPKAIPDLLRKVRPDHFSEPRLRCAWRLFDKMHSDGVKLTQDTILHSLLKHREEVGLDRIKELIVELPNGAHAKYYADQILDYDERDRARELLEYAALQCRNPGFSVDDILERVELRAAALRAKPTTGTPALKPVGVGDIITRNPALRPVVIDGLLRSGETANLIAASKVGKSFLAVGLAWSIATGRPWLGHEVEQGRVLILDNELHRETLASRLDAVARAMQIDFQEHTDDIEVLSLRSLGIDLLSLQHKLSIEPGRYKLIVFDALYRLIPDGTSENDNAQVMRLYNKLDELAAAWQTAIVVVHHSSKGDQTSKAVTDVGSGAGAISRAADTHLTIRPHDQDGLAVLESVCRSFKSPEPVSIRYEYPCWDVVAVKAELRKPKASNKDKQRQADEEANTAVLAALDKRWGSESQVVRRTGMGWARIAKAVNRLAKLGALETKRVKRNGKRVEIHRAKADFASGNETEKAGFANDFKGFS